MRSIIRLSNQSNYPGDTSYGPKKKNPNQKNNLPATQKNMITETEQKFNSLENLIKMIVHEIRNPLTSIALANQLMQQELSDGLSVTSVTRYSDIISGNIFRIEELLKDLLSANDMRGLEFDTVDIYDIIETTLGKAKDRIFLKGLDVVKDYGTNLLINGNAEKLSLAFLNIVINAVEATKIGEGRIWISAYRMNDEIKLVFQDNGMGMEPDVASHMFDKNFSCKSKGLGVGLCHVKEILEWHKASVSVVSEPGTGTSFLITFNASPR